MWLVVLMHLVIQLPTVDVSRRRQWENPSEQENVPSPEVPWENLTTVEQA